VLVEGNACLLLCFCAKKIRTRVIGHVYIALSWVGGQGKWRPVSECV